MTLDPDDLASLRALEESLWCAATRFDPVLMDRTLAPEFHEIGRSGRRHARAALLFARDPDAVINATLPLPEYHVELIAPGVALATYVSELHIGARVERARRASIWLRSGQGWKLRYHQGTAI